MEESGGGGEGTPAEKNRGAQGKGSLEGRRHQSR